MYKNKLVKEKKYLRGILIESLNIRTATMEIITIPAKSPHITGIADDSD